MQTGDVVVVGATEIAAGVFTDADGTAFRFKQVNSTGAHAFKAGESYVIADLGSGGGSVTTAGTNDASAIARAVTGISDGDTLVVGQRFTIDETLSKAQLAHINSLSGGMTFTGATNTLTKDIEAIQALVNTARVQAGSQYAAMESAVNYTTDLTAQYELGYNTVNDVNFSMETAHLAKNQILQQAATAMLAQANSGQQGLLQLIS
jgi:flagellin